MPIKYIAGGAHAGHFIGSLESKIYVTLPRFLKKSFRDWRRFYHYSGVPIFYSENIIRDEKYHELIKIWDNDDEDIFNNL